MASEEELSPMNLEENPSENEDEVISGEEEEEENEAVKRAKKIKEKVVAFKEKEQRKGVCYLSRIPPYMKVTMIRRLLLHYGVERIYLEPECKPPSSPFLFSSPLVSRPEEIRTKETRREQEPMLCRRLDRILGQEGGEDGGFGPQREENDG